MIFSGGARFMTFWIRIKAYECIFQIILHVVFLFLVVTIGVRRPIDG